VRGGLDAASAEPASPRSIAVIAAWHGRCNLLHQQEAHMASESSGNSSIVAIVAIMIMLAVGALVAWRFGVFGGGGGKSGHGIDVDIR
jgi:hypothetical protein